VDSADIKRTTRRVLLTVFVVAELVGVGSIYGLLRHEALADAERQSHVLLDLAKGVRDYTSDRILPSFPTATGTPFHETTVPSFAAHTVFKEINGKLSGYSYRESALNPTNPADRANPFEVDLVRRFQEDGATKELTGLTTVGSERTFYVAHPFRITDAQCLACHSTPAAAPPAMIAKYGSSNGFNWRLGDTVGVQLLTVPVAVQFRGTLQLVALLSTGLLVIFAAAYFAVSRALDSAVVLPLRRLTEAADAASRSNDEEASLPMGGATEVTELAQAIERLRTSLKLALQSLAEKSKLS
jgi:HAMP domain-containing protein